MKHFISLLAILMILVAPIPAWAADAWVGLPGGATQTAPCSFSESRTCWWDVAATGVTTQLDTQSCENVSVSWIANIASGANMNTATIYENHSTVISATDVTAEIVENAVLTGDPATDLYAIYGFDAGFVYARFVISAGTGRLKVHCHPRP